MLPVLVTLARSVAAAETVDGLPRVREDGALAFAEAVVHLRGIEIPLLERSCERQIRPVRCAARPVLALDRMVRGFVSCAITARRPNGELEGVCTLAPRRPGEPEVDLAARLLLEGWALTRLDAPAAYRQLERLAEARRVGLWSRDVLLR